MGLTQALTEQILELRKETSLELLVASSENEMEPGLHKKIDEAGVRKEIVNGLDVHSDFKAKARQLGRIIKENGITHVNVHNNWQLALIAYAKYGGIIPKKFKVIYSIHGYRHNASAVKSAIARGIIGSGLLMFADRVHSMSTYVSNKFRLLGYKTDLVYYMMDKPEYKKEKNEIKGAPLEMVFPAQFRHGKQQDMLIEAVKIYVDKTGDCSIRLYLPGDGERRGEMMALAKGYGLEENVVFPGKMAHKDILDLYNRTNVALVSSNVETYGRCIAEPFMLGRCLLTVPTGVALDIIKPGENGDYFNTAEELAEKLVKLHGEPELVMKMANQAFIDRRVFSRDEVMKSYLESLDKA